MSEKSDASNSRLDPPTSSRLRLTRLFITAVNNTDSHDRGLFQVSNDLFGKTKSWLKFQDWKLVNIVPDVSSTFRPSNKFHDIPLQAVNKSNQLVIDRGPLRNSQEKVQDAEPPRLFFIFGPSSSVTGIFRHSWPQSSKNMQLEAFLALSSLPWLKSNYIVVV